MPVHDSARSGVRSDKNPAWSFYRLLSILSGARTHGYVGAGSSGGTMEATTYTEVRAGEPYPIYVRLKDKTG